MSTPGMSFIPNTTTPLFLLSFSQRYHPDRFRLTVLNGDGCYAGITGNVEVNLVDFAGYEYVFNIEDGVQTSQCPDAEKFFEVSLVETTGGTFLDIDRSETLSLGDLLVFDSNVIVAGTESGVVSGECILIPNETSFCSITFDFDEGTVQVEGTELSSFVITGGTGCFSGISGTVEGSFSSSTTYEYNVEIDVDSTSDLECTSGAFDNVWLESGEDAFVDFDRNNVRSPGDIFVFGGHEIQVGNTGIVGLSYGKCVVLISGFEDGTFCSIIFEIAEGMIAAQGFYSNMIITGGSGCFRGLQGNVQGFELSENEFAYTFVLA